MNIAKRAWALGGTLSLALASGAAYSAVPDAADVTGVRECYAANAPRSSSVLAIRLAVRNAAGEETESRFKLYWRRLPTGERRGRADLGLDEIGQILDPLGSERLRLIDGDAALDERPVWVLEARPEQDDPSRYARTVTFVDRELCVPLRAEFYDREGRRTRLLRVDPARVTREASSWIAREMVFQNGEGEGGARTTLRIDEVEVDVPLAPSLLTLRALPGVGG
jgi:hypothetical protein